MTWALEHEVSELSTYMSSFSYLKLFLLPHASILTLHLNSFPLKKSYENEKKLHITVMMSTLIIELSLNIIPPLWCRTGVQSSFASEGEAAKLLIDDGKKHHRASVKQISKFEHIFSESISQLSAASDSSRYRSSLALKSGRIIGKRTRKDT